jgi:7,8-dihydropterin-6-yl-methyl-4-(beta-D-ribofuranosyl)aminobenzene 5'-phosphate synthase
VSSLKERDSWHGDNVTIDLEIHDERFLAANVRGPGTTVFTACSHAGVVNVGLEARRLLPDQPIDLLLRAVTGAEGVQQIGRGRR